MKASKMMYTKGIVVSTGKDGLAQVVIEQKGACGSGCATAEATSCRSCITASKMMATALNKAGAEKGDLVSVSLSSAKVLQSAAIIYLIPIATLLIGALTGSALTGMMQISETTAALVFGATGLAVGFFVAKKISDRISANHQMTPVIHKVIHPEEGLY